MGPVATASRRNENVTDERTASKSKLSPEELQQLERDTKFDKRELRQWYKGG